MHVLKQIAAVTRLNLRSLPLRLGTSSVIVSASRASSVCW